MGLPLVFTIMVVNFIGGYIPYIGAFLGGGLAVIVAFGEGGLGMAAVMLLVVLAANLLLENFVEPKVMGRTLDIHPLLVHHRHRARRIPLRDRRPPPGRAVHVIAGNLIGRLRSRGLLRQVMADRAAADRHRRCSTDHAKGEHAHGDLG